MSENSLRVAYESVPAASILAPPTALQARAAEAYYRMTCAPLRVPTSLRRQEPRRRRPESK